MKAEDFDKIVQNFCYDEMFHKNEVCYSLEGNYPTAICKKCPLYLFKLFFIEKIKEEAV